MLQDAGAVPGGDALRADVCLVGAGAAGIALALELDALGLDTILLEAGGLAPDATTRGLYDAENVGAPYPLAASRLRFFGGSTNHWGGVCHRLEEEDFLARPWIPHSGWPLGRADLDPYYARALALLEIPARERFAEVEQDTAAYPRLLGADGDPFAPLLWLKSPATRMGVRYRAPIEASARIRCILNASAVELVANADGTAVTGVRAVAPGGRTLSCEAARYVLCAGGIENARLLLLSDAVVRGGIGNRHDLVGRYFLEHPNRPVGTMVVAPPRGMRGFQEEDVQRRAREGLTGVWDVYWGYATTAAVRRRHRLLGCTVNATAPAGAAPGAAAVGDLVRGEAGERRPRTYGLYVVAEQTPNAESRVYLAPERDALGLRKVALDLRLVPADMRSIAKTMRMFARELARSGHGRVRLADPAGSPWFMLPGHHMGGTRMADDPRAGVTDRDGKVHGVANLYVAGSSLFPTGGCVNPTLTIVALALRQAERLNAAHRGARGGT